MHHALGDLLGSVADEAHFGDALERYAASFRADLLGGAFLASGLDQLAQWGAEFAAHPEVDWWLQSPSSEGAPALLAMGATVMLGVQTFVIIAGVLKLIPLTGVTMPFVSYGGTSLVSCMGLIGLLQGVASVNQDDITYDYEISHSMGEQAFMPHADL